MGLRSSFSSICLLATTFLMDESIAQTLLSLSSATVMVLKSLGRARPSSFTEVFMIFLSVKSAVEFWPTKRDDKGLFSAILTTPILERMGSPAKSQSR